MLSVREQAMIDMAPLWHVPLKLCLFGFTSVMLLCAWHVRSSNTRKPTLGRAQPKCPYGFGVLRKTSMVLQAAPHSFSGTSRCFAELLWGCNMLHKAVLKTFKVFYRGFRMSRIASMGLLDAWSKIPLRLQDTWQSFARSSGCYARFPLTILKAHCSVASVLTVGSTHPHALYSCYVFAPVDMFAANEAQHILLQVRSWAEIQWFSSFCRGRI